MKKIPAWPPMPRPSVPYVVSDERRDELWLRERDAAVRRLDDVDRVERRADGRERAERHVDVAVVRYRDVRELQALQRLREPHRIAEGDAVVGRADEVDLVRPVAVEARPREVDVAVALAAGAVGLDRRLVMEDAEQVRRRRAVRDDGRAVVLEAILRRVGRVGAVRVPEARDPDVALRLRDARNVVR